MLFRPVLLSTLASLTVTQGFLLPPAISSADKDIVNAMPYDVQVEASKKWLDFECANCPVAVVQPSGISWVEDLHSRLQLNFEIQHGPVDTLVLNGLQIYPVRPAMAVQPLTAVQVVEEKGVHAVGELRLGYEMKVGREASDGVFEIIKAQLQIVEIADKFVDGLKSVEVKMIKTSDGKLMIAELKTAPTTNPGGKDCQTLVCKLKKIIADKLVHVKGTKGCAGKMGHGKAAPAYGARPHHHHHHKHHGLARILHAIKSIAIHILVPVLVGVVAGFTVSLIGMVVGQTIVFLWRTLYRRGQKGAYTRLQQDETVAQISGATDDESKEFIEHCDHPPIYDSIVEEKAQE